MTNLQRPHSGPKQRAKSPPMVGPCDMLQLWSNAGLFFRAASRPVGDYTLIVYFLSSEAKPPSTPSDQALLSKAKHQAIGVGHGYGLRFDHDRLGAGGRAEDRIHVYREGNGLLAIDLDGTAHGESRGTVLPELVADYVRAHYPDFVLPEDGFVASADREVQAVVEHLLGYSS